MTASRQDRKLEYSTGIERTIIGYCWPRTARPGERLDFMVSTFGEEKPYHADLVRVFSGDATNEKAHVRIEPLESPFSGTYAGQHQATYPGSYVEVPDDPILNDLKSFTVQAYLWPSVLGQNDEGELAGIAGERESIGSLHEQTLVSRFDNCCQCGWSLFIDPRGNLAFKVGNGDGELHTVNLGKSLIKNRWFLVSAKYDAEESMLIVAAELIECATARDLAWGSESAIIKLPSYFEVPQKGALRFGAAIGAFAGGPGNRQRLPPTDVLNGKLDSVRLSRGVLNATELKAMAQLKIAKNLKSKVVGWWDFSEGIGTTMVHDLSGQHLNGTAVNMPDRAVMGVYWDRKMGLNWRYAKEGYTACHFHDDDLYDSEWTSDFSYKVSAGFPSGVYAVRLQHGAFEDYIPFFVAPGKNRPTANAAMLIPTTTHTAYTNCDLFHSLSRLREVKTENGDTEVVSEKMFPNIVTIVEEGAFMARHPELGRGTYRYHTDGSQCRHSSQKHPNLMLQIQGGYSKLAADLYIVGLIQAADLKIDIITDDLLHKEGIDLLNDYRVVMTGHHPEYLTHNMLDAIECYLDKGGRWMYLGGNGYCWVTSFHNELPGALEVRHPVEYYGQEYWNQGEMVSEFEGVDGGVSNYAIRPPNPLVGIGMDGNLHCKGAAYLRKSGAIDPRVAFIFEGVDDELLGDFGLYPGGAAGFEVDSYMPEWGSPAHAIVLASSEKFEYPYVMPNGTAAEEYRINYPVPRSDMVFFETKNGGAVFSVGSMAWAFSLNHNNYDNNIAQITLNVLKRFMDERKFDMPCFGKSASLLKTNVKTVSHK